MPYGLEGDRDKDKNLEKWMENCVKKVMKTGKDKSSSIAICKTTLKKKNYNVQEASLEITLELDKYFTKNNS